MAGLVPELAVTDWRASRRFYCDVLRFVAVYDRAEDGFSFLRLGAAELMIDQIGTGRTWDAGTGPMTPPLGRGMNLEIDVPDVTPMLEALRLAGVSLFLPVEDRWYRRDDHQIGRRQFIVADPDGYLLRFAQGLGQRSA